jgi:mannosyl-3-phosphoglycerate phosphatase
LLAPRHLIFSALEGALVDARTGSSTDAEEALSELERRHVPLILVTSQTRAEIEPLRRKLQHGHPFITESGGGIFFPDGYFNVKIPGAVRNGRYLCIAQGQPYDAVCTALDEIAEECGVGVAGFHHMSPREIAGNTGVRPRDAELARTREFDEPFFFTAADEAAIARFVETANQHGYNARRSGMFWHFSAGCDPSRAIRSVTQLFRDSTRSKLRSVGIGANAEDFVWLRATDHSILLPSLLPAGSVDSELLKTGHAKSMISGDAPGPAGWNAAILNILS